MSQITQPSKVAKYFKILKEYFALDARALIATRLAMCFLGIFDFFVRYDNSYGLGLEYYLDSTTEPYLPIVNSDTPHKGFLHRYWFARVTRLSQYIFIILHAFVLFMAIISVLYPFRTYFGLKQQQTKSSIMRGFYKFLSILFDPTLSLFIHWFCLTTIGGRTDVFNDSSDKLTRNLNLFGIFHQYYTTQKENVQLLENSPLKSDIYKHNSLNSLTTSSVPRVKAGWLSFQIAIASSLRSFLSLISTGSVRVKNETDFYYLSPQFIESCYAAPFYVVKQERTDIVVLDDKPQSTIQLKEKLDSITDIESQITTKDEQITKRHYNLYGNYGSYFGSYAFLWQILFIYIGVAISRHGNERWYGYNNAESVHDITGGSLGISEIGRIMHSFPYATWLATYITNPVEFLGSILIVFTAHWFFISLTLQWCDKIALLTDKIKTIKKEKDITIPTLLSERLPSAASVLLYRIFVLAPLPLVLFSYITVYGLQISLRLVIRLPQFQIASLILMVPCFPPVVMDVVDKLIYVFVGFFTRQDDLQQSLLSTQLLSPEKLTFIEKTPEKQSKSSEKSHEKSEDDGLRKRKNNNKSNNSKSEESADDKEDDIDELTTLLQKEKKTSTVKSSKRFGGILKTIVGIIVVIYMPYNFITGTWKIDKLGINAIFTDGLRFFNHWSLFRSPPVSQSFFVSTGHFAIVESELLKAYYHLTALSTVATTSIIQSTGEPISLQSKKFHQHSLSEKFPYIEYFSLEYPNYDTFKEAVRNEKSLGPVDFTYSYRTGEFSTPNYWTDTVQYHNTMNSMKKNLKNILTNSAPNQTIDYNSLALSNEDSIKLGLHVYESWPFSDKDVSSSRNPDWLRKLRESKEKDPKKRYIPVSVYYRMKDIVMGEKNKLTKLHKDSDYIQQKTEFIKQNPGKNIVTNVKSILYGQQLKNTTELYSGPVDYRLTENPKDVSSTIIHLSNKFTGSDLYESIFSTTPYYLGLPSVVDQAILRRYIDNSTEQYGSWRQERYYWTIFYFDPKKRSDKMARITQNKCKLWDEYLANHPEQLASQIQTVLSMNLKNDSFKDLIPQLPNNTSSRTGLQKVVRHRLFRYKVNKPDYSGSIITRKHRKITLENLPIDDIIIVCH